MASEGKKRTHEVLDSGEIVVNYPGIGKTIKFDPRAYPENVKQHWLYFGAITASRNATIGSDDDGSVGTPESMYERESAKHAQWADGVLRIARTGEERPAAPTIMVEAALLYRQLKAEARGEVCNDTLETVREALEALADSPYDEKHSKLDVLKASDAFKTALATVKEKRAAEKAKALRAKMGEAMKAGAEVF